MASEADGRVTYIAVTRKGTNLSQKYDEQYFKKSAPLHGRNLGRRCRMYDTDDREILSDHVRKEKNITMNDKADFTQGSILKKT